MQIKKGAVIAVMLLMLAIAAKISAASEATADGSLLQPLTPVSISSNVTELIFTGIIKKITDGAVLVTYKATYPLTGGNFDAIVDKEVNIIGTVVKEGSIETIRVTGVQLAHD